MTVDRAASTLAKRPDPDKKYFSPQEATRALPYVRRIVEDLVQRYGQVATARRKLDRASSEEAREHLEGEYESAMENMSELIEELNQVGVELKDLEKGLIDFPAIHEDREVYLCWRLGEEAVAHWHEIDAGFSGRQDIATLTPPATEKK